jgi:hypothetical protein
MCSSFSLSNYALSESLETNNRPVQFTKSENTHDIVMIPDEPHIATGGNPAIGDALFGNYFNEMEDLTLSSFAIRTAYQSSLHTVIGNQTEQHCSEFGCSIR